MTTELFLYLHLDLLEDFELAIMGWRLLTFFVPIDEVCGSLIGDSAGIADEDSTMGQQNRLICYHIR